MCIIVIYKKLINRYIAWYVCICQSNDLLYFSIWIKLNHMSSTEILSKHKIDKNKKIKKRRERKKKKKKEYDERKKESDERKKKESDERKKKEIEIQQNVKPSKILYDFFVNFGYINTSSDLNPNYKNR